MQTNLHLAHCLADCIWKDKLPCRSQLLLHFHEAPHVKDSWSGQVCARVNIHVHAHPHMLFLAEPPFRQNCPHFPSTQQSKFIIRPWHFKEICLFQFMFMLMNFCLYFMYKVSAKDLVLLLFTSPLLQESWSMCRMYQAHGHCPLGCSLLW